MKFQIKHTISMRTKVLLLCISCTLLALFLQTLFFQHSASAIIYYQGEVASQNSLVNMQDELYAQIKGFENNLIKIYNQTDFIDDLAKGSDGEKAAAGHSRVAYDMAMGDFDASQDVDAIYLYDMRNRLISFYRSASTPRYNYPSDIYSEPSATNAAAVSRYVASDNKVMLVSSYYNASDNKNLIRFVLKIYTDNATKKIGYIVCDTDVNAFVRTVEKYTYTNDQIVWLQPSGDRPVFCYGTPTASQKRYYDDITAAVQRNSAVEPSGKKLNDAIFFDIPQQKYGLKAMSLTQPYLQQESQRILLQSMLLIALAAILVALAAALFIARSLTIPMTRMVRTLGKIQSGQTKLRLKGLKQDEIGTLGHAINDMLDRINELIAEQYAVEILLRQTEYKALQAQVNPHFLYNSLETMGSIAASQHCGTVGAMCRAMANVFRYSMNMKEMFSTVEEEIVHIKNYMFVINVRMNNSIQLQIDVEQTLLKSRLPRLSLQPLVENAIKHGLRDKHGEKLIRIGGAKEDVGCVFFVSDNGLGMDADAMNRKLQEEYHASLNKKSSIGLGNINARMKLMFGEEYGLTVRSTPGEGTTVLLRIPCREEVNPRG